MRWDEDEGGYVREESQGPRSEGVVMMEGEGMEDEGMDDEDEGSRKVTAVRQGLVRCRPSGGRE